MEDFLINNKKIKSLNFSGTHLGLLEIIKISEILEQNSTIEELYLNGKKYVSIVF